MLPGSDRSIIFVRSNNVSKPVVVVVSDIFRAWKRPRKAGSGRAAAGDVVGVQSIASSSSSPRECDCDCDCGSGVWEGAGADDALGDGGLKVAGLSEG
jgi:hypothetical protein